MKLPIQAKRVQFGDYLADFRSSELYKHGMRIKIQDQPFQVLAALLEKPGELVTREELQKQLWSDNTFVDFERGLNAAIRKLRDALNDSAEQPRYIETLPRHGYRFIGQVAVEESPRKRTAPESSSDWSGATQIQDGRAGAISSREATGGKFRRHLLAAAAALIVIAGLGYVRWRSTVFATYSKTSVPSLAVLPFENISGDPEQEFFAEGMTDAVTTDLARVGGLRVISRTSAMKYHTPQQSLPEIAQGLKVDAVVQGSVFRSGDRVRISVQLIEASSDRHLWARSYESEVKDVLALQSEVATTVASEVKVKLTEKEKARLSKTTTLNAEAYEAYLKGKYFFSKEDENGFGKAKEYYQQSIGLDPSFAPAYTGLAETFAFMAYSGRSEPGASWQDAEKLLKKSLELDPESSLTHALIGMIQFQYRCDRAAAEKELNLALQLNPGDMAARDYYSYYLLETERYDEAIQEKEKVLRNDPVSVETSAELGLYFMEAGRNDEAISQLKKALELDPRYPPALTRLGLAYASKHQYDLAIEEIQKALEEDHSSARLANLGNIFAMAGKRDEAMDVIKELTDKSKSQWVSPADVARIYARLGNSDQAIDWLAKVVKGEDPMFDDPAFQSLRSNPRFMALEAKLRPEKGCPAF